MKKMNHIEYPETLRGKTNDELKAIIADCKLAIDAHATLPDGGNSEYYADEICYCANELYQRGKFVKALEDAVSKGELNRTA